MTGNPTAPTQDRANNSTRLATTAFVSRSLPQRIDQLGGAPLQLTDNYQAIALSRAPDDEEGIRIPGRFRAGGSNAITGLYSATWGAISQTSASPTIIRGMEGGARHEAYRSAADQISVRGQGNLGGTPSTNNIVNALWAIPDWVDYPV